MMKCKKCGNISEYIESRYIVKEGSFFSNGQPIPENYRGLSYVPCCDKCGEPHEDYLDLSTKEFFSLLNDNNNDNRLSKGKAIIRYFELDKLLESKKDVGD